MRRHAVLMPLGALTLAKVLWLDQPLGVGLLLLGCAAGAPFLPKLAQLSRGNLSFAVGAMFLLMIITVGYLPIVLPFLLPEVTVNPAKIAQSLIGLMLLPLGVGLFVKARLEDLAAQFKPFLDRLSGISLVLLILLITIVNFDKVLQVFGTRGILAGLLFIAFGCLTGWLFGGPGNDTRQVLAARNRPAQYRCCAGCRKSKLHRSGVTVMVVVIAIVGLVTLMPFAGMLGRRVPARAT